MFLYQIITSTGWRFVSNQSGAKTPKSPKRAFRDTLNIIPIWFVDTKVLCQQPQWCWNWLILICTSQGKKMILLWHHWQPVLLHIHPSSLVFYMCFYWALIAEQPPDLRPNTSRRHLNDTERPEWQCHMSSCHAFLTSFTAPPFSYTQNHGVHFQTESGLKARRSYDIRWTVPSLLDWTTILPAGLLKTEPPIDATRRLIILHPVATTTPHNVSGNAACRHALS